ncbi:acyl-CoA synthetase (NDP forming)/RimJ/RimL family protein N-acetyltransferase [Kineosporia succinea]|uniref:Acyl-CoA synthetase (NDP forming)/RimJ/RimL family protein N-acetyltransferase n=1 Tax=Kineosporia succinea TaxID=84632 RepID=A0ABT9NVT8_9ACTN|nr:GNAT family N-acetyltransferase [Kineosporia succinea]MDP9824539.1 acyl-CoA synthetase (NDP forming)/RimJ/RimL family protein N-acetyltransferase [Kineosporia succinea]
MVRDYPLHWEADVVLRDGATAHLRPITADDADALQRFHVHQSPESVYLRFFAPMPRLSPRDLHHFTNVDHSDRVALIAVLGDDIVGVGRYDRLGPSSDAAEVAFNISDAHQGRGISSVLLEHLAAAARENGIRRFVADVLPRNRKMLTVFQEAGYEVKARFDDGVIEVRFTIDPTEKSLAVMEAREHRAESRSMERLLNPSSVVLIGASRRTATVGHRLLANIVGGGFTGRLHLVHHEADQLLGLPTVKNLKDIEGPIDLALIAIPAQGVLDVVRDCAEHGVRGMVVVSSGFAETGDEGLARQRELVRTARAHGMRVVGPNSWGLINAGENVRLNMSLIPELPKEGRLGLFSQSGGLAVAVLDAVERRGLGVSTFLSAGNRADVSGNDCMQYWEEDPHTDAVGLYLESFGNPRKFSRIARRLARSKPVIVLKSGLSSFGVPPGHSVRTSTAPREAFDAMLRQSGCIRVHTVAEMLDVAQVVMHQPPPKGPNVAIVGNSDALSTLIADACVAAGLSVAHKPVALHPQASAEQFRAALTEAFAADDVHSVVAAFIPPIATEAGEVARALSEVSAGSPEIPVVACFLGVHGVNRALNNIPSYPTPEEAVRALAKAEWYARWRRRDPGERFEPADLDLGAARSIIQQALDQDEEHLGPEASAQLLRAFGITLWPRTPVTTADEAATAAFTIGYPVVLKTTAPHLRHRVDLGGVRLNIEDEAELRADFAQMRASLGPGELVVQTMAEPGVACVLRTVEDPLFGPVVSFGLGGDAIGLLGDVAHRIPPLTDVDISDLVRSVRAAPKLFGHNGAAPVDVPALEDLIGRLACLADELPEISRLELNPVVVAEHGLAVLDAEIRVARTPDRSDSARRELPS